MPDNLRYNRWLPPMPLWEDTKKRYRLGMHFNLGKWYTNYHYWSQGQWSGVAFRSLLYSWCSKTEWGHSIIRAALLSVGTWPGWSYLEIEFEFWELFIFVYGRWNSIAATFASIMFPGMRDIYQYDSMSLESILLASLPPFVREGGVGRLRAMP